jgi:DNA-directed RNA polymerase specialized sigma24 family protein
MTPNEAFHQSPPGAEGLAVQEHSGVFSTTHWSVVLEASKGDANRSAGALERLCRTYWYPLYAFVRRRSCDVHEAEDLTQAFFAHLLEKEALKTVAREKGRFRTFLLTAFANFLNNEWVKQRALKRGGTQVFTSWEELKAEERYRHEPIDHFTPEMLFERRWAFTLVEHVLMALRQEYEGANKLELFLELQPCLTAEAEPDFCGRVADGLKMNKGAVKVALHRLRRRFGERLRAEIGSTCASTDQVDDEIRHLFAALSS